MRKQVYRLFLGILCTAALTGCHTADKTNSSDAEKQKVELVVWGAEEDTELMNQIIQNFQTNYQGQADFQITYLPLPTIS